MLVSAIVFVCMCMVEMVLFMQLTVETVTTGERERTKKHTQISKIELEPELETGWLSASNYSAGDESNENISR